jgi:U3 small nucleolar RNA-associated protein 11
MMKSSVDDKGRKIADRGNVALSTDVVKLLKTQDAGYIRTMLQVTRKEREELEQRLILEEQGEARALKDGQKAKKGKHRVFVENEEEQEELVWERRRDTSKGGGASGAAVDRRR